MEHTKAYQEFKKNGNTKFVRYSEGAEMYHMSVGLRICNSFADFSGKPSSDNDIQLMVYSIRE